MACKAIIMKDSTALLLRRSRKEMESSIVNKKEAWDLPGGGIRFFETAQRGLLREIKEETSLEVAIWKPLNLYDAIRNQLHLSIFTYICTYLSGEVILSAEHDAFYWVTLYELKQMEIPKWLYRDFANAFSEYEQRKG